MLQHEIKPFQRLTIERAGQERFIVYATHADGEGLMKLAVMGVKELQQVVSNVFHKHALIEIEIGGGTEPGE